MCEGKKRQREDERVLRIENDLLKEEGLKECRGQLWGF